MEVTVIGLDGRGDGRFGRRRAGWRCGAVVAVAISAFVLGGPSLAGASTPPTAPVSLIAVMPGLKGSGAQTAATASDLVDHLWQETGQEATTDTRAFESAGFTSGGVNWFSSPKGSTKGSGTMSLLVFNTSAGAAGLVKSQEAEAVKSQGSVTVHTLAIGIPHAKAMTVSGKASGTLNTVSNAFFSVGHCLFEVGDEFPGKGKQSATVVLSVSKSMAKKAKSLCS